MFTDKLIQSLKPKATKYTQSEDTHERGESRLQINVYPTGAKKFQIQYYIDSKRKRMEFGKYGKETGFYTLAQARIRFAELAALVKDGKDPKNPDGKKEVYGLATIATLRDDFTDWYKANRKKNSYDSIMGYLEANFNPFIDPAVLACDFSEEDAKNIIFRVFNAGHHASADALKVTLSSMFKYAIKFDNSPGQHGKPKRYAIKANPIANIALDFRPRANDRYLSEDEIRTLWHATDMNKKLQAYFKLQLSLAGQRIEEVSLCHESEFDTDAALFEIPESRVKIASRGPHVVPMGSLALKVYNEVRKNRSKEGAIIPALHSPETGIARNTLQNALVMWLEKHPDFSPFTLSDIRRTCKTLMSKAQVDRDSRDMLQQHYKSDVATVHYDRYDYLREKRQAIEIWDKFLTKIVESR